MKLILRFGFLVCIFLISTVGFAQNNDWKKQGTITDSETVLKFNLSKQKVHFFELNFENFKQQLSNAPLRGTGRIP